VVLLLVTSILGPNVLCLCADGCITVQTEGSGCLDGDACCPGNETASVVAVSDSCCEWCVTVTGDINPRPVPRLDPGQLPEAACTTSDPAFSPRRAFAPARPDPAILATGPPWAVVHLRTVCLLV